MNHLTLGIIIILAVIGLVAAILLLGDTAHDDAALRYRCGAVQRHMIESQDEQALIAGCEQLQRRAGRPSG